VDADLLAQLEAISQAGIDFLHLPRLSAHFAFARDGFVALVERRGEGFGSIGAPGLLTEKGFAPLIEQGGQWVFVVKDYSQPAAPDQIAAARRLVADLKRAIQSD
jgi:hypothetical protein